MKKILAALFAISSSFCATAQNLPVPKLVYSHGQTGLPSVLSSQLALEWNGKYYYIHRGKLWVSDGTNAGTQLIKDFDGQGTAGIKAMRLTNNKIFLVVTEVTNGSELWISDGTANGTKLVKDIYPGNNSGIILRPYSDELLVPLNNEVFFYGHDGVNGVELWKSDGTATGTVMVTEINTKPNSSILDTSINMPNRPIAAGGGKVFFSADDSLNGPELWVTDGTAGGTMLLKDILPGDPQLGNTGPEQLIPFGNDVLFNVNETTTTGAIYKTDGTPGGTVKVTNDIFLSESADNAILNNKLYFFGRTATGTDEGLCVTDGTQNGTVLVKKLMLTLSSTSMKANTPYFLTAYNNKMFFNHFGASTFPQPQVELWSSDGTDAGTAEFKDLTPYLKNTSKVSSSPMHMTLFGGKLYMRASDTARNDIWVTDGTDAGTKKIVYPNTDFQSSTGPFMNVLKRSPLTVVGNSLYFCNIYTNADGYSLYKLDMFADAITDVNKHTEAILYPNPANNTLHIQAQNASTIDIYSITGSLVQSVTAIGNVQVVDISHLSPAVYTTTITFKDGSRQNLKFVKQ